MCQLLNRLTLKGNCDAACVSAHGNVFVLLREHGQSFGIHVQSRETVVVEMLNSSIEVGTDT
jgi:hypothetical protein